MKNGGRVPRGELNKYVNDMKRIYPTTSHSMIDMDMQIWWSSLMSEDHKYHSVVNKNNNENCDSSRQKV